MQNIVIEKLVIPSLEVIANIDPISLVKVVPKSDIWAIIGSIGTFGALLLLTLAELIKIYQWYREHIYLNKKNRYTIDDPHCFEWLINSGTDLRATFIKNLDIFGMVQPPAKGSIYAFTLINQGTTRDYIYKATIDNGKGKIIDVSIGHILKGNNYDPENLPYGIDPLQGEVWFVGVEDEKFVDVKDPILTIFTAAGIYRLQMDARMLMESFPAVVTK